MNVLGPKRVSLQAIHEYYSRRQCLCWCRTVHGQRREIHNDFVGFENGFFIALTPQFLVIPIIPRLSGNFARIFNARSATHWINCCKLCSVDDSIVNSFASRPSNTLSMSAGTDSDKTTEKRNTFYYFYKRLWWHALKHTRQIFSGSFVVTG